MKGLISFVVLLLFVLTSTGNVYAAGPGGGGGGGQPSWELTFVNCWDENSMTWDTYQNCDAANGTCEDQFCPC